MNRVRFAWGIVLVALSVSAHAIIIDDFSDGAFSASESGVNSWVGSQAASVLGGERDAGLLIWDNPLNRRLDLEVTGGAYYHDSGTNLLGESGLDYDGRGDETNDVSPFEVGPGLGSLDLLAMGDRIRITFLGNDLPMNAEAVVSTYRQPDDGWSIRDITVAGGQTSSFTVDFLFSDFTGDADFADVDRIAFVFDSSRAGDFAIDKIEIVPEPTSLVGIGIGLVAILRRR